MPTEWEREERDARRELQRQELAGGVMVSTSTLAKAT